MEWLTWIRFFVGVAFLVAGMVIFIIEVVGIFHIKYILNRMHMAATGDTLGIGLALVGLMILCGWQFVTLKLAVVLVFLWCSSPVSSHLIARMEIETSEDDTQYTKLNLSEKKGGD